MKKSVNKKKDEKLKQAETTKKVIENDELKVEADLIFAASMKKKFNFEAEKVEKKRSVSINLNEKPDKKKPYGRLFSN